MKRRLLILVMALLLLAGTARAEGGITSKAMLNAPGRKVGVGQGSAAESAVMAELPEASIVYYTDNLLAYTAVAQGKLDAYVYDNVQMQLTIDSGMTGVHLLPEAMDQTVKIAVGYSDVSRIPDLGDKLNRFIAQMQADGTLDDMYRRWVLEGNASMPEIPMPENPKLHLTVGTTGTVPPYSYYEGGGLTGYDIELAHRFAAWLGADLSFKVIDFDGVVPAAKSGKVDVIMSNLQYLPERAEGMPFSDILYEEKLGIMVKGDASAADEATPGFSAYAGKRVAVQTGTISGQQAEAVIPDIELAYFNTQTDALAALRARKVDAFCSDEPVIRFMMIENPDVKIVDGRLDDISLAAVFPKTEAGQALCEQYSAFVDSLWADGTMAEIDAAWFDVDEGRRVVTDYEALPETNGTLRMAVDTSVVPFAMMKDNRVVGYDVDIAARFCEANGYRLEVVPMDFSGVLPSVQSGKVDFAATGITITEERAESVLFSSPTYKGGTVLAVMNDEAGEEASASAVRWQDYNGKRLGVLTGPLMEDAAAEYFPDSEYLIFNSYPDCIAALLAGKIDAYLGDEPSMKMLHAEQPEIDYIHDRITQNNYSFAFRKDDPESAALCAELNEFIARSRADGTMDELDDIWFGMDEDRKVVDMSDLTGENGTIRVVTTSTDAPFSYVKDGRNVGYDIDLVVRFCRDRGYALVLGDVDFAGRIPAVESGKYDFTTDMNVTPEREEEVLFSDPTSYGGIVLAVKSEDLKQAAADAPGSDAAVASLDQLNGKRIGIQTGTSYTDVVLARLPDAQISYFNSYTDMAAAVETHKIDGFPGDEPVMKMMTAENDRLRLLDESLESIDMGFVLPKTAEGEKLRDELNEWIAAMKADGRMDALFEKWVDGPESGKTMPNYADLPAPNGTLRFATEAAYAPMNYMRDGEIVGLEVEMAALFCEAYGYGMTVQAMNFDGLLPAVSSGKADFVAASIAITEERAESVHFSDPYYTAGTVVAVLKAEEPAAAASPDEAKDASFWGGIKSSFNKTFIREGRWKLFTEGVLTTLLITLLAILFGTLVGFAVFMLCRNGNPAANLVTRFCLWLVQGMPMVVLLMILYYIIFGSVAISGVAVAVIGFTLTFGAAVFGLLKMGVGAVDGGQYEAAYALGYSNRRTFYRIILPQALPHVLPAYRGEIVGLIKATAIVGYIAVQDLTKMGDIVRSRTYEAFFPLIAITVIYFVLETLIGFLVSRISLNFNPKRRKPADILKGVDIHD